MYRMRGIPIGAGVELPEYVKKSKSIIGLARDENKGHTYEENLGLFRCLAQHFGASIHRLEREANRLQEKLEEHTGESYDEVVEVSMLANVESISTLSSTYKRE